MSHIQEGGLPRIQDRQDVRLCPFSIVKLIVHLCGIRSRESTDSSTLD